MSYKDFEDQEQERFLDEHCSYLDSRLILTNLQEGDFPEVRKRTKKGIKMGVEDFLKTQGNPETLYISDLTKFCFDTSTQERVQEQLRDAELSLEGIPDFAKHVQGLYGTFVYNDSLTRFKEEFK